MNRKENYHDLEQYKKTKRQQSRRHRAKYGSGSCPSHAWSDAENQLVLSHNMSDALLAKKLDRSQNAIQVHRSRLRHIK